MLVQKAVLLSLNEAAEVLPLCTKTILWSVTSKENCVLTLWLNRTDSSQPRSQGLIFFKFSLFETLFHHVLNNNYIPPKPFIISCFLK